MHRPNPYPKPYVQAAAQLTMDKAAFTISEMQMEISHLDHELEGLAADRLPATLQIARDARQQAEIGPISAAAESYAEAYRTFARGALHAARGLSLPTYYPVAKRSAPKETRARFAGYIIHACV